MNILKRISKGIQIAVNLGDIIKIIPSLGALINSISKLRDGPDPGEIDQIKQDLRALLPKLVKVKIAAENIVNTVK